ncbi:unnamed protein product [Nyctereutes procyonoides]|uniref:Protein MEMO1 n=1 Tax=Nyctereutes procyonoides TaxID=34880 RepID=A0A811Z6Y0_NYCPR|nr:unnamed protein product [Nyctereutes procyonoides]
MEPASPSACVSASGNAQLDGWLSQVQYTKDLLGPLFNENEFTIILVLVGALSDSKGQEFGKLFSKYLAISFLYSYYDESQEEIYRSFEYLDKMGINIIGQLDPVSFSNYLKKYHNALQKNAQSSQYKNWQDGSVSYVARLLKAQ